MIYILHHLASFCCILLKSWNLLSSFQHGSWPLTLSSVFKPYVLVGIESVSVVQIVMGSRVYPRAKHSVIGTTTVLCLFLYSKETHLMHGITPLYLGCIIPEESTAFEAALLFNWHLTWWCLLWSYWASKNYFERKLVGLEKMSILVSQSTITIPNGHEVVTVRVKTKSIPLWKGWKLQSLVYMSYKNQKLEIPSWETLEIGVGVTLGSGIFSNTSTLDSSNICPKPCQSTEPFGVHIGLGKIPQSLYSIGSTNIGEGWLSPSLRSMAGSTFRKGLGSLIRSIISCTSPI